MWRIEGVWAAAALPFLLLETSWVQEGRDGGSAFPAVGTPGSGPEHKHSWYLLCAWWSLRGCIRSQEKRSPFSHWIAASPEATLHFLLGL